MQLSTVEIENFYKIHPLKKITIDGKRWEYIVCGNGKDTLFLLPGGGQTAQSNFQLIDAFRDKYKVISPTIYDTDSIEEFCYGINTILKREKVNKIFLYGLSIGGMMAQSYIRRNKDKVIRLIISHSPAPRSKTYLRRIIIPLNLLNIILPAIPDRLIRFVAKKYSGGFQGVSQNNHEKYMKNINEKTKNLLYHFANEFYEKYLTKRLLTTWIRLHFDFYRNEKFTSRDLADWNGKTLILRTDNDYLADDSGEFANIYPNAEVYTFHGTAHLTFQYQFEKMQEIIADFLA